MLRKLATVVVMTGAGAALAQPLSAFLEASATGNFDARQSATEANRAQATFGQAWGALLPALTANGGWTHNQYDAVVPLPQADGTVRTVTIVAKNQLDATLKAEVPLIDTAKWAQVAASGANADAAEKRTASTRLQVQRQVVAAYYAWAAARQVLVSAQRSVEASQAQVALRDARADAGVGNELELSRARAEVERNLQLLAAAEAALSNDARQLETLTGLAPSEPGTPMREDLSLPQLSELEPGLDALPSVEAAQLDARAAERTDLASSLALVPAVNAQFTQRFTNASGFQNSPAQASGGVTFNWRLDLVGVNALRVQRANGALARIASERARRSAEDQLHSDFFNLRAAVKKVTSARAQVAAARRAADLARERSAAGVATQFDVIQAERDLFAAEVSEVEADAEAATARAQLTLSSGTPLDAEVAR
ncbi:MAG: TolC family protein [Archangium sp.]